MKKEVTIREAFNTDSIAKYSPGEEVGKTLNNGEYAYALAEALMVGISEKNSAFENEHSLLFIIQETRGDIIQAILDGKKMYRGEKYNVKLPTIDEVAVKIRAIEKRVSKGEEMETDMFEIDGETFKIGRGTPTRLAELALEDHPSKTAEKDGVVHVRLSRGDKEFSKTGIRARDLRIKEVEKLETQEDIEKEGYDAQILKGKQTLRISSKRLEEIRKEHSIKQVLRVVKNNPVAELMMKEGIISFADFNNSIGYKNNTGITSSLEVLDEKTMKRFPMKIFIDVNNITESIEHEEMGHYFLDYAELTGAMTPAEIKTLKKEVLKLVGDKKLDESSGYSVDERPEEEVVQFIARMLRDLDSKGYQVPIIKQAVKEKQKYNKEITKFRKLIRDEVFGKEMVRDLNQRMWSEYVKNDKNLTASEIFNKLSPQFPPNKKKIEHEDFENITESINELLPKEEGEADPMIYISTVVATHRAMTRMVYKKGKISKKRFVAEYNKVILEYTTQARPGKKEQGKRTVGVYAQGKNNEHTEEIIKEYNTNKEDGKGYIGTYTVEDEKVKNIVDATQIYLKGDQKKTVLAKEATNLIVKRMFDVEDDLTIPDGKEFLKKNYAQYIDPTQDSLEGMLRDKEEATTAELVSEEYPHIVEGKGRITFSKESAPLARKYTEQIETKIDEETQKGTKTPLDTPEERLNFLAKENELFIDGKINFGKKAEIYKEAKKYNRGGKIYKAFMNEAVNRNYNIKKL